MPGPLRFTDAVETDAERVAALVQIAYRGDASRAGWTTEADLLDDRRIDAPGVRRKIAATRGFVVLACDEEDLVGCFELAGRADGVGYFGMFAVRPALQAAGLGRTMLAEAERRAVADLGCTVLEMTVLEPRAELIAWYERRGYRRTGELRPFVHVDAGETVARPDLAFVVLRRTLPGG